MSNELEQFASDFAEPMTGSAYQNRSLKEGVEFYRFFPPMKSLKERQTYSAYWATHFISGQGKGDKVRKFPVLCVQERDWKRGGMVTKACPLCNARKGVAARVAAIEAAGVEQRKSKQAIAHEKAPYSAWLENHGVDGKYRLYAIDKTGAFVVLRLSTTTMKLLRTKIEELMGKKHRPLSLDRGIWFQFTREGKGRDTQDTVDVSRIDQGDGSSVLDFHSFTPDQLRTALRVFPDFEDEKNRITYPDEVYSALAELPLDAPLQAVNSVLGVIEEDEQNYDDAEQAQVQQAQVQQAQVQQAQVQQAQVQQAREDAQKAEKLAAAIYNQSFAAQAPVKVQAQPQAPTKAPLQAQAQVKAHVTQAQAPVKKLVTPQAYSDEEYEKAFADLE